MSPGSPTSKSFKLTGEIPFSSLDIPHPWNPHVILNTAYQADFVRFAPKPLNRTEDLVYALREELRKKKPYTMENLDMLRDIYGEIVKHRGKHNIETGLVRQLCSKIDKVFLHLWKGCLKSGDIDLLKELLEEAEYDPLLNQMIKVSTDLEEMKAQVPEVERVCTIRSRDALDEGGVRRASSHKRASNVALVLALSKDKAEGWQHITFNPETGKLNLSTELKFAKGDELYEESMSTTAEFEDEEVANEVLAEIVKLYKIFKVKFDVVQVHKSPYKNPAENEHEEWLLNLAKARAKKLRNSLMDLGVPKDMMSAKVEAVDRTVVMQYCVFKMDWKHIHVNAEALTITPKVEIRFEKKAYAKDYRDDTDATLEEPILARAALKEVALVATYYGYDIDICVHNPKGNKGMDEDHQVWLDEVFENRADKLTELLIDYGVQDAKIDKRVIDASEHDEVLMCRTACMGVHFELARDRTEGFLDQKNGEKIEDHILQVVGAGHEEFNGDYKPVGTQNGKVKYRHETDGPPCIAYNKEDNNWYMCNNFVLEDSIYKCRVLDGPLPWKHVDPDEHGRIPEVAIIEVPPPAPPTKRKSMRPSSVPGAPGGPRPSRAARRATRMAKRVSFKPVEY